MGFYSTKFNLESAVQDPDNTGNDLEQIAEDIMDDDGIGAHRTEVDAADGGLVNDNPAESLSNDPVDEAAMIMYESQYNYNQLMRTIGIAELNEAAYGREFVLEAVDIAGFFSRVKEILKNMFAKITAAFKKALTYLGSHLSTDKGLVKRYSKQIKDGFEKINWDNARGYAFIDDLSCVDCWNTKNMDHTLQYTKDRLKNLRDGVPKQFEDDYLGDKQEVHTEIIKILMKNMHIYGDFSIDNIADFKKRIEIWAHSDAEDPVPLKGKIKVSNIINTLESDKELKAIKDGYNKIKNSYKKALDDVSNLERDINSTNYPNMNKALALCERMTERITFEKNAQNAAYSVLIKLAKDKRAQARKIALEAIRVSDTKVQHNSTYYNMYSDTVFDNIDLV